MADVREHFKLEKDEEFRLSDYPTLARMGDYVVENLSAAPTTVVDVPHQAAAREVRAPESDSAAESATRKYQPTRHDIAAKICITGTALGLPGLEDIFDDEAVDRLLAGDNFIGDIPMDARREMVNKHIVRVQKHKDGGGELVEVTDVAEVIKLAGRSLAEFDLREWGVSDRMIEQFDQTSQLAIAAGINALRDAGLPMLPSYRETRSGKKLTVGWKLPDAIGDETGVIFASAFAGEDALIDEVTRRYTDEDYKFDHRFLLKILGMANARFAELIGARGPNTRINNACASTTTAMGMAEDWIRAGRCKRVVIISADDASGDTLMNWIGSGFLATGAATTKENVEDAALPFDKRRHGMIIGMGAVGLVIEADGLAEERGMEPLADVMATHFVNSAFHPTRLDVDHIAGEVGKMIGRAEADFKLKRDDIADKTVFVSHETYTPARGGSAAAEIAAIRNNFGERANEIVVANTKGFTGHAMGAGIEDVLAIKTLQKQRVPHIANFKEADPTLGDLRLSQGGDYPVDYALRLAAGFGSQLAVALLRFRARQEDRTFDPTLYQRWVGEVSGFANPEISVEQRTLRVVEGQPDTSPDGPDGPGHGPKNAPKTALEDLPTPPGAVGRSAQKSAPAMKIPAPTPTPAPTSTSDIDAASKPDVDPSVFEPRPIVVEAHTAAAYDLLDLQDKLSGKNVVILNGPMLVTNMVLRAVERCGATVHLFDDNAHRSPLDSDDTVCDLLDEAAILGEFNAIGRVDGIINLLGYGHDSDTPESIHRAARQTYHVARAWQEHLGGAPGADNLFVSVTGMGGRLGFDSSTRPLPMCGAICGLTKSLGREWSDAAVRLVDVAREGFYPELGLQILSQVYADAPSLEVGLIGGVRYVPVIVDAELLGGHGSTQSFAPTSDSVVVVVGGARGITAEVALDLAKRFGPKLALVGRSKLSHPNPLSIDLKAEKRLARERIQARGDRPTPVLIRRELKPLKAQIEIAENLGRMQEAGAQAEYFSCDVADPDSVSVLLERVASRFGKVDGIIHAAGVEESKFLADKDAESFDRVFCGKAVGGLNLWSAVQPYKPDFFIAFSSVAGRFGNEGQVDYSAANEVLNKLIAHINSTTDTRALSIDWTAWDGVGMATHGSMKTILEARGVEFLPVEIGAPIVANSMERGLTGEYLVAGALGEMSGDAALERSAVTGEEVHRADQLIFVDRIAESDAEHFVVERVFDAERDYFINDHVYQGVAVLPGVMGFEFMVETASQFVRNEFKNEFKTDESADASVLEVRDVKFEHAIKFHHGEPLRVIATATVHSRQAKHVVLDVILETARTSKTGRSLQKQHFSAQVTIGTAQTERPEPLVLAADATYEAGPKKMEIYRRFFHTGSFQVLEEVPHVGESVIIGYGRNPTGRLSASQNGHVFITDPMVREMALQTAGLWGMKNHSRSYLPLAIGRAMQFGVAQPGEGICVRCRRRDDASEHAIAFDVEILTQQGQLLQVMEKVELIGHRALSEDEQFEDFQRRRLTARRFTLPEAELLLNDLGLSADDILTDSERAAYERLRSETRRAEWLAARVAAKDLVHCHLRNFYGVATPLSDVVIAKDEHGAPHIELRGASKDQMGATPLPNLTITHSDGVAIAAIAAPGTSSRAGVDLESIEARNDSFADDYFSAAERALSIPASILPEGADAESVLLTTMWSVKEAVSKALGLGLHLKTGEISLKSLDSKDARIVAEVELTGKAQQAYAQLAGEQDAAAMEVRARIDGTFVLAYAWFATAGVQTAKPVADPSEKLDAANSTDADTVNNWVDMAAVAALLKHKGLLGRLDSNETKIESEQISPWKQS
jgi:3-oxoacyl-(acyl-carrier-protein) synthase/NAD(P)-dependent dehydrogenase (short-subunit alcohol dehydrogenase family)/phosphopantetheinyl transferase (holo-ACP synthase)